MDVFMLGLYIEAQVPSWFAVKPQHMRGTYDGLHVGKVQSSK